MVPRLSSRSDRGDGRGKSFRGLSAYLFTGGRDRPDPDRTPWAETINCHGSDPSQAWAEMAWTHQHADALKQSAGVRQGGRKNEFPVWHVSLNWQEGQSPDRAAMMKAAQGMLRRFGLDDHQAVVVCHTDTTHPHIHLMVNTVNPHTGRTVDVSRSAKLRLSAWARDYEREHRQILCPQREENWEAREKNKAAYRFWQHMAETSPELGKPRLKRTYDKSDSRMLWQFKKEAADFGIDKDTMPAIAEMFRESWRRAFNHQSAGQDVPAAANDPGEILARITRAQSTFTRAELARAVSAVTGGTEEFNHVFHKVLAHPELRTLPGVTSQPRYSTETVIRTEAEMASAADALAGTTRHGLKAGVAVNTDHFSDDQCAAFAHITRAEGIACIVGYAGTGKSTLLGAAREAWSASGYNVRGIALAGKAAEGLQEGSGIASTTIRRFLNGVESGRTKLGAKDIVVLDEAGMVGSSQMHALVTAIEKAGAKMVLVGDPGQLQAIDAGSAFRAIVDRAGAANLTTVRRQQNEHHQRATVALAEGRVADALKIYAREDRRNLQAHDTKSDAIGGVVASWAAQIGKPGSSIILASTNADVASINTEARAAMRAAGLLGAENRVIRVREETIGKPAQDLTMSVAIGERLLFTKNDARLNVMRGTLGTLDAIEDGRLSVTLDNGRRLDVDLASYRCLAPGYAMTVHRSQGISVSRAYVLAGANMDRHAAYVALTRHRESVELHYSRTLTRSHRDRTPAPAGFLAPDSWRPVPGIDPNEVDALARRLGRDRSKDTTLDYTRPPTPKDIVKESLRQAQENTRRQFRQAAQERRPADRAETRVERMARIRADLLEARRRTGRSGGNFERER